MLFSSHPPSRKHPEGFKMLPVLRGPKPKQLKQRTNKRNALLRSLLFLQFLHRTSLTWSMPKMNQTSLEPRFAASMDSFVHIQRPWNPVSLQTCIAFFKNSTHETLFRCRRCNKRTKSNCSFLCSSVGTPIIQSQDGYNW